MAEAQGSSEKEATNIKRFLDDLSKVHKEIFNYYGLELVPSLSVSNAGISPVFAVRKLSKKSPVSKIYKE